ncbi:MAG: hypothetical protein FWE43_00550 [Streptococcaceae bacterium]|nr:hypothetical protein [Streptococcaceae bacterium]MCL2680966.1 hypothetical protein [Streptococcaceae bacterium]
MKKALNVSYIAGLILLGLIIGLVFVLIYTVTGFTNLESIPNSLFDILSKIYFPYLVQVFAVSAVFMLMLDFIIVLIIKRWRKVRDIKVRKEKGGPIMRYWHNYRTIHITFILISLFLTISISAPVTIMSAFTAIISISVLVSNTLEKMSRKDLENRRSNNEEQSNIEDK